jgi:2,4-dienoyl-CoA reductase-like NADH-dependent reductase (Old Yellow Enzyme family)
MFHASTRRFWEAEFEGSDLNLAGWTKKITGAPVITVGSIGLDNDFINSFLGKRCSSRSIEDLEIKFGYNEFDFAAIGRALISDAEWVNKIENNSNDIRLFDLKDLAEL